MTEGCCFYSVSKDRWPEKSLLLAGGDNRAGGGVGGVRRGDGQGYAEWGGQKCGGDRKSVV